MRSKMLLWKNKKIFWGKRGAMGEMTLMFARLFLLTFATFILLGISSEVYSYDINVRDVEARIMARAVVNCVVENELGMVEGGVKDEKILYSFLDYCGITGDLDRYFVRLTVLGVENVIVFQQGDSGAKWVIDLVRSQRKYMNVLNTETGEGGIKEVNSFLEYSPGYFKHVYLIKGDSDVRSGSDLQIEVEVLVNADS